MAREVHERENMLRDAKALVERVELRLASVKLPQEFFAGFRVGGALSFYFGLDPVYQFNSRGQLRRAFDRDRIIKAEHGRLVAWLPIRTKESTEMLRHELSDALQEQFCQTTITSLRTLHQVLQQKEFAMVGQVPEDADVVNRLCQWLEELQEITIADSPGINPVVPKP